MTVVRLGMRLVYGVVMLTQPEFPSTWDQLGKVVNTAKLCMVRRFRVQEVRVGMSP